MALLVFPVIPIELQLEVLAYLPADGRPHPARAVCRAWRAAANAAAVPPEWFRPALLGSPDVAEADRGAWLDFVYSRRAASPHPLPNRPRGPRLSDMELPDGVDLTPFSPFWRGRRDEELRARIAGGPDWHWLMVHVSPYAVYFDPTRRRRPLMGLKFASDYRSEAFAWWAARTAYRSRGHGPEGAARCLYLQAVSAAAGGYAAVGIRYMKWALRCHPGPRTAEVLGTMFAQACARGDYRVVAWCLRSCPMPAKNVLDGLAKALSEGRAEVAEFVYARVAAARRPEFWAAWAAGVRPAATAEGAALIAQIFGPVAQKGGAP